jgi:enolase
VSTPTLARLHARQVLDSRGRPTVEVDAHGSDGALGRAIVPSGASTGRHEALELRDRDDPAFAGFGVARAVDHVNAILGPALSGRPLLDQPALDAALVALDGTPDRSRLGGNALLGASLAVAHAAATSRRVPLHRHLHDLWTHQAATRGVDAGTPTLPLPMVNMISGGLHAGRQLDIQDVLTVPVGAASYSEALDWTVRVYHALKRTLARRGEESALVGDEGGFGPRLARNEDALERVVDAIDHAGLTPGTDVALALDIAATHLHDPQAGRYLLESEGGRALTPDELTDRVADWCERYPIVSVEDPLAEDDWPAWSALTARLGPRLQVVGDDLLCTQVPRIQRAVAARAANAVLVKMNQVGTLTETLDALALARSRGWNAVVSARSGETEDTTMVDLAVATAAGQIKVGSVARSERLAKYNALLRIEEALGGPGRAPYAGRAALRHA